MFLNILEFIYSLNLPGAHISISEPTLNPPIFLNYLGTPMFLSYLGTPMFLNILELPYKKNYLNYLNSEPTWSPPITRSKRKGMMAKKSTRFMGCLKNLHFLGEQTNLTIYSITKNRTAQFSK